MRKIDETAARQSGTNALEHYVHNTISLDELASEFTKNEALRAFLINDKIAECYGCSENLQATVSVETKVENPAISEEEIENTVVNLLKKPLGKTCCYLYDSSSIYRLLFLDLGRANVSDSNRNARRHGSNPCLFFIRK